MADEFAPSWAIGAGNATLETTCFDAIAALAVAACRRLGLNLGNAVYGIVPKVIVLFSPTSCRAALALAATLSLSGCAMMGQVRMGPVSEMLKPQPDLCGAAALIDVVGQPFTTLADHPLSGPLRVLWPGQEITDEVVPNRLNAEITRDQLILRLSCG